MSCNNVKLTKYHMTRCALSACWLNVISALKGGLTVSAALLPVNTETTALKLPRMYSQSLDFVSHSDLTNTSAKEAKTARLKSAIGKCMISGWALGAQSGTRSMFKLFSWSLPGYFTFRDDECVLIIFHLPSIFFKIDVATPLR